MGQYYCWVNVDRKEYLCPNDFDLGNKMHETMNSDNALLCALRELLSADWKGFRVIFLGDECHAPDELSNEIFNILLKQEAESGCSGYLFDTVLETYRNVSGLFKTAEKDVRDEIAYYLNALKTDGYIPPNEYGIDVNDPYKGLFLREGKSFRYTINRSKKIGYSPEGLKVFLSDGSELDQADPLPILMAYGGRRSDVGEWLGDIIEVNDVLPKDYTLITELKIDW